MSLRSLGLILWIALWILVLELGLEFRAHTRGWTTLAFGTVEVEAEDDRAGFGPSEGFPFRSPLVPREKIPGTLRIWLASSSYAEDLPLPVVEVFPNLIPDLLASVGMTAQVLNASAAGMATHRNLDALKLDGAAWAPDLVVLYQMSNDIDEIARLVEREGIADGAGSPFDLAEETAAGEGTHRPEGLTALVERTTLFEQLSNQIGTRLVASQVLADSLGDGGDVAFERLIRDFLAAVDAIGARPVLCTFAVSHPVSSIDSIPTEWERHLHRYNTYLSAHGWAGSVKRLNAVIRRIAAAEDILLVEVAEPIAGRAEFFRDFTHLTSAGHRAVAEVIADALARELRR